MNCEVRVEGELNYRLINNEIVNGLKNFCSVFCNVFDHSMDNPIIQSLHGLN